jgi:hypothetical protein
MLADAREVIVRQRRLMDLMIRDEEFLVPIDATARTLLVGLMARMVNWEGDESMSAIRAGQGLLVGLLRCGHCGRKLHVRYWGGRGTHARYLCKGDYDDGGQYGIGFGGALVDRRLGHELLQDGAASVSYSDGDALGDLGDHSPDGRSPR